MMKPIIVLTIAAAMLINEGVSAQTIHGQIMDENEKPLSGVTVIVKQTSRRTISGPDGGFSIRADSGERLVITSPGYDAQEILVSSGADLRIVLELSLASLLNTAVVNKGYYTTTQKLNTGNVSAIKAADIEEQPVSNVLAAMAGRAPGLLVTQSNGLPGSAFSVGIRGHNSIQSGNGPLYLIDGVPFTNKSISLGVISANGLQSPFNNINPGDIESIEILKDADATAIYGSRGANGVVLITTKKGKTDKVKLDINAYTGGGKITRMLKLLNTQQYVEMRREAFANDNIAPDLFSAPDLVAWDTTRYTDWKKLLIGGTAATTDVQASLSGGSTQTQFFLGAAFHRSTTVYPRTFPDERGSVHLNLTHSSQDNKFRVAFTSSFVTDKITLPGQDLTSYIKLSPNAPKLYDSTGKLNWSEGGASFSNPFAYLLQTSDARADNLMSNLVVNYQLLPGLDLKANLGYIGMQLRQEFIYPGASVNPLYNFTGFAEYSDNNYKSWIIEPQVEYQNAWGKAKLEVLAGTSFQEEKADGSITYASNFSSDALLREPSAAGNVTVANNNTLYRYQAVFGRINLNWGDKYLVNLTGRRDGSSRFGPDRQFSNFGAVGAAWVFSKEPFVKDGFPALKYGKLRGSYGVTGNDQIGDYQYLNTYFPSVYPYQGVTGLMPTQLFNPDYSWETSHKLELGLELGFFNERLIAMISYYHNRSSNQLINSSLPIQTGFNSVIRNFPALVRNTGWEYQLNVTLVKNRDLSWDAFFNLTLPRNKLLEFRDISSSGYASKYSIGWPLDIIKRVHQAGVDPQTGVFQFRDKDNHLTATPAFPDDYTVFKDMAPSYYGGLGNKLQYKGFSLSIFFQWVRQLGFNYAYNNTTPGSLSNQPVEVLGRWRKPGDISTMQLFTTTDPGSTAYYYYSTASDGAVSDASYVRLKNAALSYSLPGQWVNRINASSARVYLMGENLATLTGYKGADPETGNTSNLPPLKIWTAGIQIIF